MARVKGGLGAKKRHNRTLKLAKGYRGARSKQYRVAKQSVMRALTSSYAGRKQKRARVRAHCEDSVRRAALAIATKPHVQASKRRVGATGD